MPGHRFDQPLNARGLTLVELAVGVVLAGVAALVSAGLFKAGILTYNYAYRQTRVLSSARKALAGDGSRHGMVWTTQAAASVNGLSASSLALVPPASPAVTFLLAQGNLYQSQLGVSTLQAEAVSSATVKYYNLDSTGRVMVSTAAGSATLVVSQVTMTAALPQDKAYSFLSGAQLRNHP